jgi:hypothetical protein
MFIKRNFFIIIIILGCFCAITAVLAARELYGDYPDIPGATTPKDTDSPLSIYLNYIYSFAIFLGAAISFIMLVWAGTRYITSSGKPYKVKVAKEQIVAGIVGLIIMLSSYLILNTINPDLVKINIPSLSEINVDIEIPDEVDLPGLEHQEIPIGTLITSEITLSSFIKATDTDPKIDITDKDDNPIYNSYFDEDVTKYPTDYQGGLHGRRLKRIHQVASTTLPASDMLNFLTKNLVEKTEELHRKDQELNNLAQQCGCGNCQKINNGCTGPSCSGGTCTCNGDPCPQRERMEELREEIPPYYDEDKNGGPAPIPCRMAILEYFGGAFDSFLEGNGDLVKNEEYEDQSYWHTGEGYYNSTGPYYTGGLSTDELRAIIKECIDAGEIEQDLYDDSDPDNKHWSVEEVIDLMATSTENKGTYSPKTDPPERDIQTNLEHLKIILEFLKLGQTLLTPEHPVGCFPQAYSFLQFFQLTDSLECKLEDLEKIPMGEVRVIEDPATFYCPLYPTDTFADTETMLLEDVPPETACRPIIEIPIGTTMDMAIKLMEDILRELQNIYDQGNEMLKQNKEQLTKEEELFDESDQLVEKTSEDYLKPDCKLYCTSECKCVQVEEGVCACYCTPCTDTSGLLTKIKAEINAVYFKIYGFFQNITDAGEKIQKAMESIFESFYKLNSEYPETIPENTEVVNHPDAGEKVYINYDICCQAKNGYCRDENTKEFIFSDDMAEKVDYTVKQKILQIQKLLNRSRDFGTYTVLLEQLIEMDIAKEEELDNLLETPDALLDLSNCDVLIADLVEQAESGHEGKIFESCWLAKSENFNHIIAQECSLDPPYDCDYFNPLVKEKKSHLLCYCYDQAFYNEISSNFFCCNVKN